MMAKQKFSYRNIIRLPKTGKQSVGYEAILAAYAKDPFDALILECPKDWQFSYQESLAKNIGLPEHVKVVFRDDRSDCVRLSPAVTSIRYPRKQIGADAVEALLADEFVSCEKFYRGELVLR